MGWGTGRRGQRCWPGGPREDARSQREERPLGVALEGSGAAEEMAQVRLSHLYLQSHPPEKCRQPSLAKAGHMGKGVP